MADYRIVEIRATDRSMNSMMDDLLKREGIERDANLEYSLGLIDEDSQLVATGSCFKNTLRCMAVDSMHRGEGLLNQIVSALMDYEVRRGMVNMFLYTKCDKEDIFRDLGFYRIAVVQDRLVFMENRKNGFRNYLDNLKRETENAVGEIKNSDRIASVVMNANPFTLGHRYLLETAAEESDILHVFVVSEDSSVIPFSVRYRLVQEGCRNTGRIVFHRTGDYLISDATFPSYFLKDRDTVILSHAGLDATVFLQIASSLGITARYAGEEPFSHVTELYNRVMKEKLEKNGISLRVIPRKETGGNIVSASVVRKNIQEGHLDQVKEMVPESTFRYFLSEEAKPVIEKIRNMKDVIHY